MQELSMTLEYVPDGAVDTPLVLLAHFEPRDAAVLHQLVCDLSAGRCPEMPVHAIQGVEAIDGCRLVLRAGVRDQGIVREPRGFVCILSPESWAGVADLIKPFCEEGTARIFQYLDETSEIKLVLSVDGGW
jgi:hypothetical protein